MSRGSSESAREAWEGWRWTRSNRSIASGNENHIVQAFRRNARRLDSWSAASRFPSRSPSLSSSSSSSSCSSSETYALQSPEPQIEAEVDFDVNAALTASETESSTAANPENVVNLVPRIISPSIMDRDDSGVRWSPNRSRHEFLSINTGGAGITLYNANGKAVPGTFDYAMVAKHLDYPALTTYDWCSTINGVVAIGTKGGEVHLLRIDDNSNATITLPLKLQRSSQAVAFNTTGLLAVGLDRVRNDQCLQIWDINQRLSGWDKTNSGFQMANPPTEITPLHKLEPSVSVTSIRFFEDQPQTLVVGIKNLRVTIYDLREPNVAVMSFNTRNNNNLAIDHADSNYFASSNLESAGVTVWDRRAGGSKMSSSKTYIDAVDSGALPWGCVLNTNSIINSEKNTTVRSLRYCRDQRGLLGVLSSSGELQAIQTTQVYMDEENRIDGSPELLQVRRSYTLEWPVFSSHFSGTANQQIGSFDWMNLGSANYQPRVVTRRINGTLDVKMVPNGVEKALFEFLDIKSNHQKLDNTTLPVFEDANETMRTYGPLAGSALGSEVIFGQSGTKLHKQPLANTSSPQSDENSLKRKSDITYRNASWSYSALARNGEPGKMNPKDEGVRTEKSTVAGPAKQFSSSRVRHAQYFATIIDKQLSENAYGGLSTITRARAVDGYLFDCGKNQKLVENDSWLQDMWSWIAGAQEAVDNHGMISSKIDLSYMGVHSVWNNDLGINPSSRLIDTSEIPGGHEWTSAIAGINRDAGRRYFEGIATQKPHHRQLCLAICGWGKSADELDQDLEGFESRGQYTKAAVWALCEKAPKRAIEALQRGGSNLMFVALALELQGVGAVAIDKARWDLLFQQHPQMVEDPYLRAIYALISTGHWRAIANEDSLPLRERVGIALHNFSDHELGIWLQGELETAIQNGDIEGIVLAGLTDKMMDIFANHVDNFGDVQTPVLAMSFTVPAYFSDIRFNAFRSTYRQYLNQHRLHVRRAVFDAQSSKLSKLRTGASNIKPPPRQVTLRCIHCNSGISNDLKNSDVTPQVKEARDKVSSGEESRNPLIVAGTNGGISCPTCGKHLPRCAVCLQTLGLPRSKDQERRVSAGDWEEKKADLQRSFIIFCTKCPHAMHADHARDWFERHTECPVSECRCQCYEGEARLRKEREQRNGFEAQLVERRKENEAN